MNNIVQSNRILNINRIKKSIFFRTVLCTVLIAFLGTTIVPSSFAQVLATPASALVPLSPAFTPTLVRGIRVYPDNPLKFDFIVDSGDTGLKGDELKKESEKLIRYFLASLTIPEDELWVNLSPYEKDRIVPDELGSTEMGRDMLAQDYLLKQITASLTNPDSDLGKEFWQKIYKKAYEQYGTTNIPVDTFNKVWIMPGKAVVYEQADKAFVVESKLKVMLEQDYLAQQNSRGSGLVDRGSSNENRTPNPATATLTSNIFRDIFIPALEKEVNVGKNFAQLRQIYNAIILGYWFKTKLKSSILNKVYSDQRKIRGIEIGGSGIGDRGSNHEQRTTNNASQSDVQIIYQQYLDTFKKGVCNMMKVEYDQYAKKSVPRKYFAGGVNVTKFEVGKELIFTKDHSACSPLIKRALFTFILAVTLALATSQGVFGQNSEKKYSREDLNDPVELVQALGTESAKEAYSASMEEDQLVIFDNFGSLVDAFGKEAASKMFLEAEKAEGSGRAFSYVVPLSQAIGKDAAVKLLEEIIKDHPMAIFYDDYFNLLKEAFDLDIAKHLVNMAMEKDPQIVFEHIGFFLDFDWATKERFEELIKKNAYFGFLSRKELERVFKFGKEWWNKLAAEEPIDAYRSGYKQDVGIDILLNASIEIAAEPLLEFLKLPDNAENKAKAVNLILEVREMVKEIPALDSTKSVINLFASGFDSRVLEELEEAAGVTKIQSFKPYTGKNKGVSLNDSIIKAIVETKGPLVILGYLHGNTDFISFDDFTRLSFEDLGKALIERERRGNGKISEAIIMLWSCYGYDFEENLDIFLSNVENYMEGEKADVPFLVISAAGKGMTVPQGGSPYYQDPYFGEDYFESVSRGYSGKGPVNIDHFFKGENEDVLKSGNPKISIRLKPEDLQDLIKKYFDIEIKILSPKSLEIGDNKLGKPKESDFTFQFRGYVVVGDEKTKTAYVVPVAASSGLTTLRRGFMTFLVAANLLYLVSCGTKSRFEHDVEKEKIAYQQEINKVGAMNKISQVASDTVNPQSMTMKEFVEIFGWLTPGPDSLQAFYDRYKGSATIEDVGDYIKKDLGIIYSDEKDSLGNRGSNPADVATDKMASCQGYARIFSFLSRYLGIQTDNYLGKYDAAIPGTDPAMRFTHEFNIVRRPDGQIQIVDLATNDTRYTVSRPFKVSDFYDEGEMEGLNKVFTLKADPEIGEAFRRLFDNLEEIQDPVIFYGTIKEIDLYNQFFLIETANQANKYLYAIFDSAVADYKKNPDQFHQQALDTAKKVSGMADVFIKLIDETPSGNWYFLPKDRVYFDEFKKRINDFIRSVEKEYGVKNKGRSQPQNIKTKASSDIKTPAASPLGPQGEALSSPLAEAPVAAVRPDIFGDVKGEIERLRASFKDKEALDRILTLVKEKEYRQPVTNDQKKRFLELIDRYKGSSKDTNRVMLSDFVYVEDFVFDFNEILRELELRLKAREKIKPHTFCAVKEVNDHFSYYILYLASSDRTFKETSGASFSANLDHVIAILSDQKNMRFMTKYFKKMLTAVGENPLLKRKSEGKKIEYRESYHIVKEIIEFLERSPWIKIEDFQHIFMHRFYRWNEFGIFRPMSWTDEIRNDVIRNRIMYKKLSEGKTNALSRKEITVILAARGDHNGALERGSGMNAFRNHGYGVVYFEFGNLKELSEIVDLIKRTKKVKNVVIDIHADQKRQGTYDFDSAYPAEMSLKDQPYFASMGFFDIFSDHGNTALILAGCESGKGGYRARNWVNMFAKIRPPDKKVTIFGPMIKTDALHIKFAEEGQEPDVVDVKFSSDSYPDNKTYKRGVKKAVKKYRKSGITGFGNERGGISENDIPLGPELLSLKNMLDFIIKNNLNIALLPLPQGNLAAEAFAVNYIEQLDIGDKIPVFVFDKRKFQGVKKDPRTGKISRRDFRGWNRLGIVFVPLGEIDKLYKSDKWIFENADGVDAQILKEMQRLKIPSLAPSQVVIDASSSDALGGIDFNAKNMNVETKGSSAVDFALPANFENLRPEDIIGFTPVIINITPVTDFMKLLGLADEDNGQEVKSGSGDSLSMGKELELIGDSV